MGVEIEGIYQANAWQVYGNAGWNSSKQTVPLVDPDAYSAYPDLIINAGFTYHVKKAMSVTINNLIYDGFASVDPGDVIAPSYVDEGALSTLFRTDLSVNWTPHMVTADCELYLTILDIFDREDVAASMSTVEYGDGTPGRKLIAGVRLGF